jgi:ADP-ribose pyrophosphatase YjhB (NUDIX family)
VTDLRLRPAARVIVVDEDERVLLVRFDFPHESSVWATVGGGLEPGETHEQAALRELAEEAGLEGVELGPLVWTRTHVFELGMKWDGQEEVYFLLRTAFFEPRPRLSWDQLESEFVTDVRWWTLDELERSEERFAPGQLRELLRALLRDGPPERPIQVGV